MNYRNLLPTIALASLAFASVAQADPIAQSGVKGAGVAKNAAGQGAEIKVKLGNFVLKNNKTAVFGELEFETANKAEKTVSSLVVSPLNNKLPVAGTLTVTGNVATLEAKGTLRVRSKGQVIKTDGKVNLTVTDNGKTGDTFTISFTAGTETRTFNGTLAKGNLIVFTSTPNP